MTLDLSRFSKRQFVWIAVAAVLGLLGLMILIGHTGPKMMATGPDAGASPFDLLGAWGPIIAALVALVKGIAARDPVEAIAALKALASSPQSLELARRAEQAILQRLKDLHPEHPEVLNAISALAGELAKINFPPVEPKGT